MTDTACKSDLIDVTVKIHHQTERAILVSNDGKRDGAVWLPLSQIEVSSDGSGIVEVTLPQWLARGTGLI